MRKLRGGCIHHDHGVLGAACFPAAEERKLVAEVRRYDDIRFVTSGINCPGNPPNPTDPADYAAYYAERFSNNRWEERTEKFMAELDIAGYHYRITDENGDRVTEAMHELTCLVDGGELMGIFSGDPCNEDQYTTPHCHAFEGRALIIIRAKEPGKVTVTVGSNGLRAAAATVVAK